MFNYFFDQNPRRDSVMWIYQVTSYMLPVCLYADLMPSSYILLHISCYSVTRVFRMVLICGLENMVIVVTPSPCRLDCTPLFRRHQCLSVYIHCTGEGECLSNAWEEQALNPSSPGCWVGACSSPVDSYHLLSAVPSISSFYLSTSSLEDSCYWWWRWGKVS